jgi:anti-anti-sigma regulatory factor
MAGADDDRVLQDIFPQTALDAVPQPMYVYDWDGVTAGCNVAAETFWRLPREHIVGKFNAYAYAETDEGAHFRVLVRALRAALGDGVTTVCEPVLIDTGAVDVTKHVSQAKAYIENTIFPMRDRSGAIRFAGVLQRDITELVERREAVEQATARIAAQDELIAALEEAQHAIDEQRRTIEELSAPILQVWPGVLTLPVIGAVDEDRATEIMHKLLEEVTRTRSRFAILDLTGVRSVDATTAAHLVGILKAVTLLGARGLVSGISPAVAEALSQLAVDLAGFETYRDLGDALRRTIRAGG